MSRTYSPEELEAVRLQNLADAAEAADRARTVLQPPPGHVKLYDPRRDNLRFGSGSPSFAGPDTTPDLIQFGQIEPGVAIVPADHPLLPALRKRYPKILVMEPGEVIGKLYACEDCDKEFTTKARLRAHRQAEHRPAPEAKAAPAKAAPRPASRPAPARAAEPVEPPLDDDAVEAPQDTVEPSSED